MYDEIVDGVLGSFVGNLFGKREKIGSGAGNINTTLSARDDLLTSTTNPEDWDR